MNLNDYGQVIAKKDHLVFFSGDRFSPARCSYKSLWVQQVHGKTIVEATKTPAIADGHWTKKNHIALGIKTADCLPVFVYGDGLIMALHIGWRGFTNNILLKALEKFSDLDKLHIYIGPHIGYNSFQVNKSIVMNILLAQKLSWKDAYSNDWIKKSYDRPKHLYVDLQAILIAQLQGQGVSKITSNQIDTCKSPFHFSHRRNPARVGTNYSLIVKI